jgi:SM-20-related protein
MTQHGVLDIERVPRADERLQRASRIAAAVETDGLVVVPGFLGEHPLAALRARLLALDDAGALSPASVGRAARRHADVAVRADRTRWLADAPSEPAEVALQGALDEVRIALNRRLMLGLFSFEGHYAIYPPGGGYARHKDRFRDDDARVLSCVLYLNAPWHASDGGALRIHRDAAPPLDVLPHGGTLVAFLSERFDHEVLPASRERWSLTGWFRRRAG